MQDPLSSHPLHPAWGEDPGRIVSGGSSGNRFVRQFLLCTPLTHDDTLETYYMIVKEEHGSNVQPSALSLAAAAAIVR